PVYDSRMRQRGLVTVVLAVAIPLVSAAAESPAPVSKACALVTAEEASTVLGPNAERLEADQKDSCIFQRGEETLRRVVRIEEIKSSGGKFLDIVRRPAMAEKGYTIKDEPSLGKGSFSAVKADSLDFELALPPGVLDIGLREEAGKTIPPSLLEKLRAV